MEGRYLGLGRVGLAHASRRLISIVRDGVEMGVMTDRMQEHYSTIRPEEARQAGEKVMQQLPQLRVVNGSEDGGTNEGTDPPNSRSPKCKTAG